MNIDLNILKNTLCAAMCAEITLHKKNDSLIVVRTPFFFSDGDPYQIFIKERPGGILRLTDNGHTMMHLSYENDTSKFREGTRAIIFNQILTEIGISENNGEFYIDTLSDNLVTSIFKLGQGITKIGDLSFLNRLRRKAHFMKTWKKICFEW